MKKKDILLGTFMMLCSLSAYVFLVQVQNDEPVTPNVLYEDVSEQGKTVTSPDIDVFKRVVTVFMDLLPAS